MAEGQGFGGWLKGAQSIFTDPLFMAGASVYQGGDLSQSMMQAQKTAAFANEQRRKADMQSRWQQMVQSGQGVPDQMRPFLPFLSPEQGAGMLGQHALTAPERQRAAEMHAARLKQVGAQTAATYQSADPRMHAMRLAIAQAQLEAARRKANQTVTINGRVVSISPDGQVKELYVAPPTPMDQVKLGVVKQLGIVPGQPAPAPAPQPQITPQSYDGGVVSSDPNLIPTGGGEPPPTVQPTAGPQPPQQGPFGNLSQADRTRLGMSMLFPQLGPVLGSMNKGNEWATPTKNKIDEGIFNTFEQAARLQQIRAQFKPEYLTLGGGSKALWLKMKDKVGLGQLDPKEKQYLTGYSQFRQSALENINRFIKEITGAQMSEQEAVRIRQAIPDPGQGVFDGNSPAEFKAKMDQAMSQVRLAMARYNYLRSGKWEGGVFKGSMAKGAPISLEQMGKIMDRRTTQLEQEAKLRMPSAPQEEQAVWIRARLHEEFGV